MPSIQKFCDAMRWAADSDQVGYSQSDRSSLTAADFFGGGRYNTDCSALVIAALQHAGFDTGGATYTGNMSANLTARGWRRVAPDGRPQRGDILLNDADHVAVWLGDCLAQASIGEGGLVSGGARGDQTRGEVNTRSYYNYPWDCYLRYEGAGEEGLDMNDEQMRKLAGYIAEAVAGYGYGADAKAQFDERGRKGGKMNRNNYNVDRMALTVLNGLADKLDRIAAKLGA